ncbi:hypothetical protein JTB14_037182 [Gonioctena quinquepunctata]|nr:hypothetical protein JTB14_037182 [Gonioctena quinquepunctata]
MAGLNDFAPARGACVSGGHGYQQNTSISLQLLYLSVRSLILELKNRRTKTSGRKEQLIQRLLDYDRNHNFVQQAADLAGLAAKDAASNDNITHDDEDDLNGQYHDWMNDENSNDCVDDCDD